MNHKPSILIVDDDADDREIIRDAFTSSLPDCAYVFLENGERLLNHLEDSPETGLPSLIMLDLNMPGKDGRELVKIIKEHKGFRHVPIVVFTTSSSHRDKKTVYDAGANCFITKPDTFNKLLELTNAIALLWLR